MLLELASEEVMISRLAGEAIPILCQHHRHHQRPRGPARGPYQASPGSLRSVRGLLPPPGPRSLHGRHTPVGLQAAGRVSSRFLLVRLSRRGRRGWPKGRTSSGRGRSWKAWSIPYEFSGVYAEGFGELPKRAHVRLACVTLYPVHSVLAHAGPVGEFLLSQGSPNP